MTTPRSVDQPASRRVNVPPLARAVLAAVVAFLVGFGWQYARAERLERRLTVATRGAELARLEAMLGGAVIEAQRGSFELARRQASEFYTAAQRFVAARPADQTRQPSARGSTAGAAATPELALRRVLQGRDATITLLSRDDAQAADVLARQLVEYRTALHGAVPAPAASGASAPRR